MIAKLMLVTVADGEPLALTRSRAVCVAGPVGFQTKLPLVLPLPLIGTAAASISYEVPPSRLSSIRTVSVAGRLWNQEMVVGVPMYRPWINEGPENEIDGVTTLKVDSANAACPPASWAVTRTRTPVPVAVGVHGH